MTTKIERNYQANYKDIADTVKVFRKTDNVEGLVEHLAALLTPSQFRMLFVMEFNKIPLQVVYVDSEGNRIEEGN